MGTPTTSTKQTKNENTTTNETCPKVQWKTTMHVTITTVAFDPPRGRMEN